MEPVGMGEFVELDDLLLFDHLQVACINAVTLEGFLMSNAIGPMVVTPEVSGR